jgi:general secretion pathway protein E
MLLEDGIVSSEELHRALAFQKSYGGRLGGILLRFGALSEDRLLATLSRQLGIPILDADVFPSDPALFLGAIEQSGYPVEWWIDQEALPWLDDKELLHCVARDPLATALHEFLAAAFGERPLCWYLIANQSLDRALDAVQRAAQASATRLFDDVKRTVEPSTEGAGHLN